MKKVTVIDNATGQRMTLKVPQAWSDAEIQATVEIERARNRMGQQPDVTQSMSTMEKGLAGVGRGMSNAARQLGNLLGIVDDETLAEYRELDRPLMETTPGMLGSLAGEVATTAPLAGGAAGTIARGAQRLAPAMRTGRFTGAMGRGATEGALEGAVLAGPENRLQGAMTGAAWGAPAGALGQAVGGGITQPIPEAQQLMDMGVTLTPGRMRPAGALNQLESSLEELPGIGTGLKQVREAGPEQFTEAMIRRTQPPGAPPITGGDTPDMLDEVYQQFNDAYDVVKPFPVPDQSIGTVWRDFGTIAESPDYLLKQSERDSLRRFLDGQLERILRRPSRTIGDLINVRSGIRKQKASAAKAANPNQGVVDVLNAADDTISNEIEMLLPDEQMRNYARQVNDQYGLYKIVEDAVYRAGDRGVPSNTQWSGAVKRATPKGTYARGGGRLRDEVRAARRVFEGQPKTGVRLLPLTMMGLGVGTWGGMAGLGTDFGTSALGTSLLASLALSRGGRNFARGQTGMQRGLMNRLSQPVAGSTIPPILRGIAPVMATNEEDY